MLVKNGSQSFMQCDVCGCKSQTMKSDISMPTGFSSVLIGEFMNVCDGCKAELKRDVLNMKKQCKTG
jgi:hypothetical protein